jgi:hypothetical protein
MTAICVREMIDAWTGRAEALRSRADHVKAAMVVDAESNQVSVWLMEIATETGIYGLENHVR